MEKANPQQKIEPLVEKCKMKLLLGLHDVRPDLTEPGCRSAIERGDGPA
jgi:hypothetical protein